MVSVTPPLAFNAIGYTHTVTFLCGSAAHVLIPPDALPAGCYNLTVTVSDITTGGGSTFVSASCAGVSPPSLESVDCSSVANPICPAGYLPQGNPTTCVAATTLAATSRNEVSVTINPAAPHVYLFDFTGYVGTLPGGRCPTGTTPTAQISVAGSEGTRTVGPVCAFKLEAEKKYLEVQNVTIIPVQSGQSGLATCTATNFPEDNDQGVPIDQDNEALCANGVGQVVDTVTGGQSCGGSPIIFPFGLRAATPCFFKAKARGMVVLKTGVDCTQEPPNGTSAVDAGFPPDPFTNIEPTYHCAQGVLSVIDVGVPNVTLNLTTSGQFSPICIPQSRLVTATPTPSTTTTVVTLPTGFPTPFPTFTPIGTPVPTGTPTPTETPIPTETAGPGTVVATPAPPGSPIAFRQPAICFLTNSSTSTVTTNEVGVVGASSESVSAEIGATDWDLDGDVADDVHEVIARGQFFVNGLPVPSSPMYVTKMFPTSPPQGTWCPEVGPPILTDSTGTAVCEETTGTEPHGEIVPTDLSFVYNCEEFGIHSYFGVSEPPAFTAIGDFGDPLCVVPNGFGPLSVTATLSSPVNTQPPISTTLTLGNFTAATATAVPSETTAATEVPGAATDTPTATSTPTVTNTPTMTPTDTPTATVTSTPTPQPTATTVVLRFTLRAARVAKVNNPGNMQGLDSVVHKQPVWLMMYYTIKSLPKSTTVSRAYEILYHKKILVKLLFKGTVTPKSVGSSVPYVKYTVPSTLPYGTYSFRGVLTVMGKTQIREWKFTIVRNASVSLKATRHMSLMLRTGL